MKLQALEPSIRGRASRFDPAWRSRTYDQRAYDLRTIDAVRLECLTDLNFR